MGAITRMGDVRIRPSADLCVSEAKVPFVFVSFPGIRTDDSWSAEKLRANDKSRRHRSTP